MAEADMKVLCDTSVLVAAMVEEHPAHPRALPWLSKARNNEVELTVGAHALAELYAVLTRLPLRPRISPAVARRLIRENVEAYASVIALTAEEYRQVLDDMAGLGLSGGVIYDGVAAAAARKALVDRLLTLNESDFRRVWPTAGNRIAVP
jgi:predicted nucleic acid-binding protein